MQNLDTSNPTKLILELFHIQTNTSFELPANLFVIRIGKPNDENPPEIDVSQLPDSDVVSRMHAMLHIEGSTYYIEDINSSNGTYLNQTRLESRQRYPLNLGDKIDLGQGGKVTFIFQHKQNVIYTSNSTATTPATEIAPDSLENSKKTLVDRSTQLVGLALMVAGIVILTASTQIGVFVRIPGILLCFAGVALLTLKRVNRNLGWILIALGIGVILFTGSVFASVNLLSILASSAVFFAGYQLFISGKILNQDLRSLKELIQK